MKSKEDSEIHDDEGLGTFLIPLQTLVSEFLDIFTSSSSSFLSTDTSSSSSPCSSSSRWLTFLPKDLWWLIFDFINLHDLVHFASVSHHTRDNLLRGFVLTSIRVVANAHGREWLSQRGCFIGRNLTIPFAHSEILSMCISKSFIVTDGSHDDQDGFGDGKRNCNSADDHHHHDDTNNDTNNDTDDNDKKNSHHIHMKKKELLLVSSSDHTLSVWDPHASWKCIKVLERHNGFVQSLCSINDDGLVAAGSLGTINIWNTKSFRDNNIKCEMTLKGHHDTISALCVDNTNQILISTSFDKTIILWSIVTGRCLNKIDYIHDGYVNTLSFLNDMYVISSSSDNTVKIWNPHIEKYRHFIDQKVSNKTTNDNIVDTIGDHENDNLQFEAEVLDIYYEQGWSICVLSQGNGFAIGSSGLIKVYRRRALLSSCQSSSSSSLLTAHNTTMYESIITLEGHCLNITSLIELPDGRLLSGSYDGMIKIWNIVENMSSSNEKIHVEQRCLRTISLHSNCESIRCLSLLEGNVVGDDCVVSGGLNGHINVTSLNDRYKLKVDERSSS